MTEGEHPLNSQKCGSEFLGVSLAAMLRKTPQLGVITQVITPNQTSSYN